MEEIEKLLIDAELEPSYSNVNLGRALFLLRGQLHEKPFVMKTLRKFVDDADDTFKRVMCPPGCGDCVGYPERSAILDREEVAKSVPELADFLEAVIVQHCDSFEMMDLVSQCILHLVTTSTSVRHGLRKSWSVWFPNFVKAVFMQVSSMTTTSMAASALDFFIKSFDSIMALTQTLTRVPPFTLMPMDFDGIRRMAMFVLLHESSPSTFSCKHHIEAWKLLSFVLSSSISSVSPIFDTLKIRPVFFPNTDVDMDEERVRFSIFFGFCEMLLLSKQHLVPASAVFANFIWPCRDAFVPGPHFTIKSAALFLVCIGACADDDFDGDYYDEHCRKLASFAKTFMFCMNAYLTRRADELPQHCWHLNINKCATKYMVQHWDLLANTLYADNRKQLLNMVLRLFETFEPYASTGTWKTCGLNPYMRELLRLALETLVVGVDHAQEVCERVTEGGYGDVVVVTSGNITILDLLLYG